MVDEYQDTNALQDALYRCLASPAGDDLFLVGDLKQSIYRFRQADPSIFREKLDRWPALPGGRPARARRRVLPAKTPCWRWMQISVRPRRWWRASTSFLSSS